MMQRNLLIVDDERNIQSSMQRALRPDGYNIYCAQSGADALKVLEKHKINVIISDQRMPQMTGSELFNKVSHRFPETIRIVLSGYSDFSAVTDAINQGSIYKFLTKPWDDSLLRWHVLEAFQRYEMSWHNRQLTEIFNSTMEGIMITDHSGVIQATNPAFSAITGYSEGEVAGRTPRLLRSDKEAPELHQQMWQNLESQGHWQGEVWNRRKNGEDYPQWMTISTLPSEYGEKSQYVALFIDITKQKEREACIEYQAYHDALTTLPNRRLFHDRLERSLAQVERSGESLAVLFLDLDRFKNINDSLGHEVGDHLLQEVAKRLKEIVRNEDTVSRLGGDEFTVLLSRIAKRKEAEKVVRKLIIAFRKPFEIDGHTLHISSSIGAALFPCDGETPERLMKNADSAMYRAKEAGRNNYCFYSQKMNVHSENRFTLENDLHDALERGELTPFYQLQREAHSGAVSGFEVLLRWNHPERGMVMPSEFISLAEESGLIVPIGAWVLEEACKQAKIWVDAGQADLTVAVNLSARQFQEPDLVKQVAEVLDKTGLPAKHLELEITENLLLQHSDKNSAVLQELHELGVCLALDDFGTGYSSLSYLKKFPFDRLKIDQSFVRDLPGSHEDAALVDAIITLGHTLGLEIIAEGVESEAQLTFLRDRGCDLIQGYLFSEPLPAERAAQFLEGEYTQQRPNL